MKNFQLVSDVTDAMGDTRFCLEYANGIMFVTVAEVKAKWISLALDYLEDNLIIR